MFIIIIVVVIILETGSALDSNDSKALDDDENTGPELNLPDDWKSGIIPYALNFFSPNPKRLLGLVKKGINFLENNSCLKFEEQNPVKAAQLEDYTYLYYTYSGVSEDCCLKYYTKDYGRRTVLITPVCSDAHEVAHATLHGLGLTHPEGVGFSDVNVVPMTQGWCEGILQMKATRLQKNIATSKKRIVELRATPRFVHRWVNVGAHQGIRTGNNNNSVTTGFLKNSKKMPRRKRKKVFVRMG